MARILLGLTDFKGPEIVGVVDEGYEGYEGHAFHGVPVLKEAQVQDACWDGVLITALEEIEEAESQLVQLGYLKKWFGRCREGRPWTIEASIDDRR